MGRIKECMKQFLHCLLELNAKVLPGRSLPRHNHVACKLTQPTGHFTDWVSPLSPQVYHPKLTVTVLSNAVSKGLKADW